MSLQSFFAERYFNFFDKDGSGYISIDEFVETLQTLGAHTDLDKLKFMFDIFDADGESHNLWNITEILPKFTGLTDLTETNAKLP